MLQAGIEDHSVQEKKRAADVEFLQAYIQEHYTESIDFAHAVAEQHLSLQRITQLFKARYGTTPHRYQTELQMADAKWLLRYSNLSVTEIAVQIGFDDAYYFSRCFKKHTGASPRAFRMQRKAE